MSGTTTDFRSVMTAYISQGPKLKDIHVNVLMGNIAAKVKEVNDTPTVDFIRRLEDFEDWLRSKGIKDENTPITIDHLQGFLEGYIPSKDIRSIRGAMEKLSNESLKMIENLFPERVDYFRVKENVSDKDKRSIDTMLQEMQEFTKEQQYRERDQKLITADYLELMNMLPDKPSRAEAQKYLNTLLATKGIPMKFVNQAGGAGSTPINVIPLIRNLFQEPVGTPSATAAVPITDKDYLQTIIKSTLLALLQGTGLEAKIQSLDQSKMMGLLVDGVKTGLLASIASLSKSAASTTGSDAMSKAALGTATLSAIASLGSSATAATPNPALQEATLKSAILSNISALSTKVVPPDTGFQDAIAKAAVLSLIATLAQAQPESQDKAVAALNKAVNDIQTRTEDTATTQLDLSKETIKMMLLVAQSALMNMATSTDDIDAKVNAAIATQLKEVNDKIENEVKRLTTPVVAAAALPPNMEEITNQLIADANSATGLIPKLLEDGALKQAIDQAQKAANEVASLKSNLDVNNASINTVLDTQHFIQDTLNTLRNRVDNLAPKDTTPTPSSTSSTEVSELREKVNSLVTQAFAQQLKTKIETSISNLTQKLEALEAKVKALEGTVQQHDTRITNLDLHQDKLDKTFDELTILLKKRGDEIAQAGGAGQDPAKQVDPVAQAKEFRKHLDEVKKNLRGITDAFTGLQSRYKKFESSIPQKEGEGEEKNRKYNIQTKTDEDQKAAVGLYSYLKEEGRKFVDEVKEIVAEKKQKILDSQKLINKVLDADAANPMTMKTALNAKNLIEGDYSKQDDSGILSMMDGLYGAIKSEYDEIYSAVKAASEGIKQQQEYNIRNKQNPVVGLPYGYAGPTKGGNGQSGGVDPIPIATQFDNLITKVNTLMKDVVQKTDDVYARKLNPTMSAAVVGEPTMFMNLYNNYIENKVAEGQVVAARKLTEEMAANKLIPADVMKISSTDKVIFVFVMIIFRMITLEITKYIIEKGKIQTLPWALGAFLFIYAILFVAFVMFVNLDMYRLRILFNYINLHGNTSGVFMHLGLMWLFSFVIFMVMWNINFPFKGIKVTAISEHERTDLMYRLEVLTMIVFIFLALMIIISQ